MISAVDEAGKPSFKFRLGDVDGKKVVLANLDSHTTTWVWEPQTDDYEGALAAIKYLNDLASKKIVPPEATRITVNELAE